MVVGPWAVVCHFMCSHSTFPKAEMKNMPLGTAGVLDLLPAGKASLNVAHLMGVPLREVPHFRSWLKNMDTVTRCRSHTSRHLTFLAICIDQTGYAQRGHVPSGHLLVKLCIIFRRYVFLTVGPASDSEKLHLVGAFNGHVRCFTLRWFASAPV